MVSEDDVARRWSRRRDQQHQHPCLFCRVNRPVNRTGTSYKCLDHEFWDMRTFNGFGPGSGTNLWVWSRIWDQSLCVRLRSVILALCNGLRILRKHGSEGGCAGTDPQDIPSRNAKMTLFKRTQNFRSRPRDESADS